MPAPPAADEPADGRQCRHRHRHPPHRPHRRRQPGPGRRDRRARRSPIPGQTETNKILNNLVPSFNFPQPSIADGTDALRPATLRGLSPDQTLVLVNGKRRHVSALLNINGTVGRGSAAVDLNLIPGLAIQRIEVLRDGASSQYGSDAIAGVINIQLRNADHGGRATATYGRYETTLDDVANITGLQTNAGQPVLDPADNRVFARQQRRRAAAQRRRDLDDRRQFRPADRRGLRQPHRRISRPQPDQPRRLRPQAQLQPAGAAAFDPRELTFDRLEFRYGDAETEDYHLLPQRRHAARRRLGALRLRLLRQARRPQRRQLPQPERRRQPRLRGARARPRRRPPPISCR